MRRHARDSHGRRQSLSGRRCGHSRAAYSIFELVIVITIVAVLLGMAVPSMSGALDRIAVRAAAGDVASILSSARLLAIAGRASVAVHIDTATGVLRIQRGAEVLLGRDIAQAHGVRVWRNRDSLAFDPRGLGWGAADLKVILRRGAAVETVFVSRLGRVR